MHQFSSSQAGIVESLPFSDHIYRSLQRFGLIIVCAMLVAAFATPALAQESYPGPAVGPGAAPTVVIESYPGADAPIPALIIEPANPTAYPEPNQPTTGPASAPTADTGSVGQPAVATPVPMPSVPVDSGSQVSLILVGLVLLGLVVVVGVILTRRRK